tara:strand:- start:1949 stop:2617 length:669 start_codon:yes stop_codon:yes gene_type:complete
MRIESKLCHLSENKAVVLVDGWINDKKVGSSLAEGPTVEIAEDKAISRLKKRINEINNNESTMNLLNRINDEKKENDELLSINKLDANNESPEPSDWSNELIAIDSEIDRLNWSRDEEINFLVKTFGYNNRSKITKYDELVKYLQILKKIDKSILTKANSENKNRLIEESDVILKELSWNKNQGREYLLKEFNVSTRLDLDERQLIKFVANLKVIKNQYLSK